MTAPTITRPFARSTANPVGLPCGRDDGIDSGVAVLVLAVRDGTQVAVVDLLGYPCGQHHLDDIASAMNDPGVIELVGARAALDLIWSLAGPQRSAIAMAPPTAAGSELSSLGLSARELDVIDLVSAGLTNPEIAAQMYVSINTVKTYIRSSYRKIGVERRSQAVSWGLRHGLGGHHEV